MPAELPFDIMPVIGRWLHISAAVVAVGGTAFIRFVLRPSVEASLSDEARQSLRNTLAPRWTRVVYLSILAIILTGAYNVAHMFPQHKGQPVYHGLFGLKLLLALILFGIALMLTGRSTSSESVRRQAPHWMLASVLLGLVIILLSVMLKSLPYSISIPA